MQRRTISQWNDLDRVWELLARQEWIFAKTMASNPHWYTLRKNWAADADFCWVVEQIRAYGYQKSFQSKVYTQLDVNEHFYWTMGWPIGELSWGWPRLQVAGTILINRKPIARETPYDVIAPRYDAMFRDPASLAENARVFGLLGDLDGLDVLDVGCGTGLAYEYVGPRVSRYVGVDPSHGMLQRFQAHYGIHPGALVCAPLRAYASAARFDRVVALFGVGSYLSDEELTRIPSLLKPGGRATVMFYDAGYQPVTHQNAGLSLPFVAWSPARLAHLTPPGAVVVYDRIGHHVVCQLDMPGED